VSLAANHRLFRSLTREIYTVLTTIRHRPDKPSAHVAYHFLWNRSKIGNRFALLEPGPGIVLADHASSILNFHQFTDRRFNPHVLP